jgi:hypothetical protein
MTSVADPDPHPDSDPHVLGLQDPDPALDPDPDSSANLVRKPVFSTVL